MMSHFSFGSFLNVWITYCIFTYFSAWTYYVHLFAQNIMLVVEKYANWNPPVACRRMADVVPGQRFTMMCPKSKAGTLIQSRLQFSDINLRLKHTENSRSSHTHFHSKPTFKNLSDGRRQPFFFCFFNLSSSVIRCIVKRSFSGKSANYDSLLLVLVVLCTGWAWKRLINALLLYCLS